MTEIDPFQDEEYNQRWLERALARVKQDENGCWIWQGPKQRRGYGLMSHKYFVRQHHVHRILYQLSYGQRLGRWDYVCHACDVTSCVNPAHMWIGTPADNQKDMQAKRRGKYQKQSACKHGHEYNNQNTRMTNGRRTCRICARIRQRIVAGWPEDLAKNTPVTKLGYRPVGAEFSTNTKTRKREPVVRSDITPEEIRRLLALAGLSQVAGAKRIGIGERTMRRCIAGEIRLIEPAAIALKALAT
jgi:hypothetical protein